MGSIAYDFLSDSILFNDDNLENRFEKVSIGQLENELSDYRNHCIKNYNSLMSDIKKESSALKVLASIDETSIKLLTQTALYVEQYIIDDPLFKLTKLKSEFSKVATQMLGFTQDSVNKREVAKVCRYLKDITPMVYGNFVKIVPISANLEKDDSAINFPKDNYRDSLPESILKYFHDNLIIEALEKAEAGWVVKQRLEPSRGLCIGFKNHREEKRYVYHLLEQEVMGYNDADRTITFKQSLPDFPPEKELFDSWMEQSINGSALDIFEKIYSENVFATRLNSTYLCDNHFTANLLNQIFDKRESLNSFVANELINLDLPVFSNISIEKLMDIRLHEEDVFTNFRIELEKQFRELRNTKDPNELLVKKENIFHELNVVQCGKISKTVNTIRKKRIVDSAIFLGSLLCTAQTGGLSLLASAVMFGKGYKDYFDYSSKIRENPSYLLWKIQK